MPGPPPKRSSERRRRNKPAVPLETVDLSKTIAKVVEIPKAKSTWHEAAKLWYESLSKSGQAVFLEPSDWAVAYLMAESLSRDLKPQPIGITEDGVVKMAQVPMKGASLSAYLKTMTELLVTEASRRRAQIEIERANLRAGAEAEETPAGVTSIESRRADRFARKSGT